MMPSEFDLFPYSDKFLSGKPFEQGEKDDLTSEVETVY